LFQGGAPVPALVVDGIHYYNVGCNGFVDDLDLVAAVLMDGLAPLPPIEGRGSVGAPRKDPTSNHPSHRVDTATNRSGRNALHVLEAGLSTMEEVGGGLLGIQKGPTQ
jgi:hypothetical protein